MEWAVAHRSPRQNEPRRLRRAGGEKGMLRGPLGILHRDARPKICSGEHIVSPAGAEGGRVGARGSTSATRGLPICTGGARLRPSPSLERPLRHERFRTTLALELGPPSGDHPIDLLAEPDPGAYNIRKVANSTRATSQCHGSAEFAPQTPMWAAVGALTRSTPGLNSTAFWPTPIEFTLKVGGNRTALHSRHPKPCASNR